MYNSSSFSPFNNKFWQLKDLSVDHLYFWVRFQRASHLLKRPFCVRSLQIRLDNIIFIYMVQWYYLGFNVSAVIVNLKQNTRKQHINNAKNSTLDGRLWVGGGEEKDGIRSEDIFLENAVYYTIRYEGTQFLCFIIISVYCQIFFN